MAVDGAHGGRAPARLIRALPHGRHVVRNMLGPDLIVEKPSNRAWPAEVLATVFGDIILVIIIDGVGSDDGDVEVAVLRVDLKTVWIPEAVGVDFPPDAGLPEERIVFRDRAVFVDAQDLSAQILKVLCRPLGIDQA